MKNGIILALIALIGVNCSKEVAKIGIDTPDFNSDTENYQGLEESYQGLKDFFSLERKEQSIYDKLATKNNLIWNDNFVDLNRHVTEIIKEYEKGFSSDSDSLCISISKYDDKTDSGWDIQSSIDFKIIKNGYEIHFTYYFNDFDFTRTLYCTVMKESENGIIHDSKTNEIEDLLLFLNTADKILDQEETNLSSAYIDPKIGDLEDNFLSIELISKISSNY